MLTTPVRRPFTGVLVHTQIFVVATNYPGSTVHTSSTILPMITTNTTTNGTKRDPPTPRYERLYRSSVGGALVFRFSFFNRYYYSPALRSPVWTRSPRYGFFETDAEVQNQDLHDPGSRYGFNTPPVARAAAKGRMPLGIALAKCMRSRAPGKIGRRLEKVRTPTDFSLGSSPGKTPLRLLQPCFQE